MPLGMIAKKLIAVKTRFADLVGTETHDDFNETDIINIIMTCLTGFFFFRIMIFPENFSENQMKNDAAVLVRFMSRGLGRKKESD